jgi:hypothetical protein
MEHTAVQFATKVSQQDYDDHFINDHTKEKIEKNYAEPYTK